MDEADKEVPSAPSADSAAPLTAHADWLRAVAWSLAASVLLPGEYEPNATRAEAKAQVSGMVLSLIDSDLGIEQMLWAFAAAWATDLCAQMDAPNVRSRLLAQRAASKRLAKDPKQLAMAQVKALWEKSRDIGKLAVRGEKTKLANAMAERFDLDAKNLMANFALWRRSQLAQRSLLLRAPLGPVQPGADREGTNEFPTVPGQRRCGSKRASCALLRCRPPSLGHGHSIMP